MLVDKSYDDRSLRLQLRQHGKRPVIPHRDFKPHDAANNTRINTTIYQQLSLVETVISLQAQIRDRGYQLDLVASAA